MQHENRLLNLTEEGKRRLNLIREAEAAIMKDSSDQVVAYNEAIKAADAGLEGLTGKIVSAEVALLQERDLGLAGPDKLKEMFDELEALRTTEAKLLADRQAATEALAEVELTKEQRRAKAEEVADEYLANARLKEVFRTIEDGVRNAMTEGFTAAVFDEDWKEALRSALRSLAEQSLSQGLNLGLDALAGKEGGNGRTLFSAIGSLFGAQTNDAPVVDAAVAANPVASAGQHASDAARPIEVAVITVPNEASADSAAQRMTARGARAVVAKANGRGGISTGSVVPGRQ